MDVIGNTIVGGLARLAAGALAGWLAKQGINDANTAQVIVSGVLAVLTGWWSAYVKK